MLGRIRWLRFNNALCMHLSHKKELVQDLMRRSMRCRATMGQRRGSKMEVVVAVVSEMGADEMGRGSEGGKKNGSRGLVQIVSGRWGLVDDYCALSDLA